MSSKPRVLFVLTSHDKLGDTGKPTGWYLPEFAHPYEELESHCDIVIASTKGGKAPLDPASVEATKDDKVSVNFHENKSQLWENTEKLSSFKGKANEFDAIFYVGGHGPLWDLVDNEDSKSIIKEFYESGKVVSAVCHAPCVLLNVKLSNGEYLIQDQEVAGFTNDEEEAVGATKAVPYLLETELKKKSNKYVKGENWAAKVAKGRDGRLLTGQNPASAGPLAKAVLEQIQVK